jgi:hypothetical protein
MVSAISRPAPARSVRVAMTKLMGIVFTGSLLLGACGGGSAGKLEKLKDEACACTDKACAEAVNKKMDDAMEDMMKEYGGKEPDAETQKKLGTTMMEAGLCLAKHMK